MTLSPADASHLDKLKATLQGEKQATKFEHLVAALIGNLLGIGVAVAKTGFQHGGDLGTSGRQGRHLRIECKKYADTTELSERELLGEVDQALQRDLALEAWILASTRAAPEQLEQALERHAQGIGVPIVIVDWKGDGVPALAALCASAPDIVEALFSAAAARHAKALRKVAATAIESLRRDLQTWTLGFENLRIASHRQLQQIWTSPRDAAAVLNQNASGGATGKMVDRPSVSKALNAWWSGPAATDVPAIVLGADGVGKTWATLAWLIRHAGTQPVVLVIASSTVKGLAAASTISVKRFLAERFYELSDGVRDINHWQRRLEHLLQRPGDEGPVITVLFDGMNQEPSVPWVKLLNVLQAGPFVGRIRVIASTRNLHFEDKLKSLRGLVVGPMTTEVGAYDDVLGGELDQRLALEGLTRDQLHSDLLELARTPRLFDLVVRLKDRLIAPGAITRHRLLWEYGRVTWGERDGSSFSEADWRTWLSEIARRYRDGVRTFSMKIVGETTHRPDLSEHEVLARLSDIIDGQFMTVGSGGVLRFRPDVVAHALGAALLDQLGECGDARFDDLGADLNQWLDPIAGFDERAEILRASVSILVEQRASVSTPLAGVLVTAWLQSQNLTDGHRQELTALATLLFSALLDAIEHSAGYAQASARLWAVSALRSIPRLPGEAFDHVVARSRTWLSEVSRDVRPAQVTSEEIERYRVARFEGRIGVDASGPIRVLGVDLMLVDHSTGVVAKTVPSILEGFPLAQASAVFETAAVAVTVGGRSPAWNGLGWLCLLNEADPMETAEALRALSAAVATRTPEPGINPLLPARVASLLLWQIGEEADDYSASMLDPNIDKVVTYEADYLPNPGHSFFPVERRHADSVLRDVTIPLKLRAERARDLWLDPNFQAPAPFVDEIRSMAAAFDATSLDSHKGPSFEDHNFEILEPVLARCAPEQLVRITRAKLIQDNVPAEARYQRAYKAAEHLILVGRSEAVAARALRLSGREPHRFNELHAATQLLLLELQSEEGASQIETLLEAELELILVDLLPILRPVTQEDAEALLERWRTASLQQKSNLICLLRNGPVAKSNVLWNWLTAIADGPETSLHGVVFRALTDADGPRFGRYLLHKNWFWSPGGDFWVNHYGSGAVISATIALPFDQVAPRLAPWRLLEAARIRGEHPIEVRFAANILSKEFSAAGVEVPDLDAVVTIERTIEGTGPFYLAVTPTDPPHDSGDPASSWRRATDPEAQVELWKRAYETAKTRIQHAQAAGANLYLAFVDADDMVPVVRHASDVVDLWLQGASGGAGDFRRRVILAEGAFLALCEALLRCDPDRGIRLWRVLRRTVTTRFVGKAKIDDMIHMVFRAPTSPGLVALREELLNLERSGTDKDLFELAVAAHLSDRGEWFAAMTAADTTSPFVWRRKRALVLEGFAAGNSLPQPLAWPDRHLRTDHDHLRHRSARFRYRDACARYWWKRYLDASDAETAYAAWILFARAADRRAWAWMQQNADAARSQDTLYRLKMIHAKINAADAMRRMEKSEDQLDKKFLDRDIQDGVGPWGKAIS